MITSPDRERLIFVLILLIAVNVLLLIDRVTEANYVNTRLAETHKLNHDSLLQSRQTAAKLKALHDAVHASEQDAPAKPPVQWNGLE